MTDQNVHQGDIQIKDALQNAYARIKELSANRPGLHGQKALFSVMTDWNPAEMIGIRPRPLALSLYKELITDSIWAYQRHNYGYKNLRSFPLLHSILGVPYIDVRASLNSFIPGELDDKISAKLVDYYCNSLAECPVDHDKVEFNIVFSCYYFNFPQKIKKLLNYNFSELELDRIKFALLNLTNNIVSTRDGYYVQDLSKVDQLDQRHQEIMSSNLSPHDKLYWLVEDCKRFGTLPFAGLARAGFIAVQFLRSLVESRLLTEDESAAFMSSLQTVANELTQDSQLYFSHQMSRSEMLKKYGHLRPGTYDILSQRYDEAFELYFKSTKQQPKGSSKPRFAIPELTRVRINEKLTENGLQISADDLFKFMKKAIEGREYSKFIFTRHVSDILKLISEITANYEISKEDSSFLRIQYFLEGYSEVPSNSLVDRLKSAVLTNKSDYAITQQVRLPQLISFPDDIYEFDLGDTEPNFITSGRIVTEIIVVDELTETDLANKIVCIKSADPGYDWIFSRNIAGLVTMFGGSNSHMAIRCAELNIPAVIGCGDKNYANWSSSKRIQIDCANRSVNIINKFNS